MHCRLAALAAAVTVIGGCGDNTEPSSNIKPTAAFTSECDPAACLFTNLSTDADGTLEAYEWNFGDGSGPATTWDAAHAYAATGAYPVTLTVTDDDGATAARTVQVSVTEVTSPVNQPPTAAFTVSCPDLTCHFTNRSFDPDAGGRVTGYDWDFGDGSRHATTLDAQHTYAAAGEYTVTLTVRDDRAATATSIGAATARLPNVPPTAFLVWLCTDLTCEFRDQSEDSDGSVIGYRWNFGDGTTSFDRNPSHAFSVPGYYQIELSVTDDRGGTNALLWGLYLPAPQFTVSCESVTCSFAIDGSFPGVYWRFGDGTESNEPSPTHRYEVTEPTTFTVTMLYSDLWLDTYMNSRDVTVTP